MTASAVTGKDDFHPDQISTRTATPIQLYEQQNGAPIARDLLLGRRQSLPPAGKLGQQVSGPARVDGNLQQHRGGLGAVEGDLVACMDSHGRYSFPSAVAQLRGKDAFITVVGVAEAVTVTSTESPRLSAGKPVQVPQSGTAWAGSRATATLMRS